jgi:hypothetical protein
LTYNGAAVYGAKWLKSATSTLTRTNASVDMVAAPGVDASTPTNDFDTAEVFGEITDVEDTLGNKFVRFPKHYIKITDTPTYLLFQVCKKRMPGSYCPQCHIDQDTGLELDYVYIGKHVASLDGGGTKLASLPDTYPLINKNIVDFRNYARENNAGGLLGYQQLDLHAYDMLQILFLIEFANLDSQAVMQGWSTGVYGATELLTADTAAANTIVVANVTGAKFAVGQPAALGSTQGGNQVFYGRNITQIDVDTPGAGSTTITVDGAAFNATTGNYLYNVAWKSGFGADIAASSGSLGSNSTGKFPMKYRGVENLYSNLWQFVDGVNINDNQAWVCKNADDYASNLFASPYEQLSYVNANANNYVKLMGYDLTHPFAKFPVDVSANWYRDYYYQAAGQRIAFVGASWNYGGDAGLFHWLLNNSSASTRVNIGGRLLKKAL